MGALFASLQAVLVAASAAWGQPAELPVTVVEQAADDEFNLDLPLKLADKAAQVSVRFDEQANGDRLELRITPAELSLVRAEGGAEKPLAGPAPLKLDEQGAVTITLRRRADAVRVFAAQRRALSAWLPAAAGKLSYAAPAGVVNAEGLYYQPYAAPEFADDFMRAETDSPGEWEVLCGKWENTALVDKLRFVPRAANSFAFAAHPASPAMAKAGESFWDDYQCAVSVRVPGPGTSGLAFRVQDAANCYVFSAGFADREAAGQTVLKLAKIVAGTEQLLGRKVVAVPPGQWYRLRASLDGDRIETFLDDAPGFSVTDDAFSQGPIGLVATDCETVYFDDAEVREQRRFSDDFERDGLARWQTRAGEWEVAPADRSGNLCLQKKADGAAPAVVGRPTWTDYELRVRVRSGGGAFGLTFCWHNPTDYWLWRWLPRRGGRQQLVRVTAAGETVMDEAPLALSSREWLTATVRARRDYAAAGIDGRPPVEALLPPGSAGLVGVWADRGSRPAFDAVSVDFPPGYVPPKLPQTMLTDAEMKEQFANPAEGWFNVQDEAHQPQRVGMNWNKGEYFQPVDVAFPLSGVGGAAGKVTVTVEGDQTAAGGGYDFVLTSEANSPKLHLSLRQGGRVLAEGDATVEAASGTRQVRLGRRGTFLVGYVDDKLVVSYREGQEPGTR